MKLFKFENWELQITEEALTIKAFRDLWKRDRTKNKDNAIRELGFIYHTYDPRSDYMFIIDEQERIDIVKEQEGFPAKWKPDKIMEEAIGVYKFLTQTTSSMLLEDTRVMVEKIRKQLKELDLTLLDDKGKLVYTFNTVVSTIKQMPDLAKTIGDAERALNLEIEENSKIRGQKVKKLLEDGISGFLDR